MGWQKANMHPRKGERSQYLVGNVPSRINNYLWKMLQFQVTEERDIIGLAVCVGFSWSDSGISPYESAFVFWC